MLLVVCFKMEKIAEETRNFPGIVLSQAHIKTHKSHCQMFGCTKKTDIPEYLGMTIPFVTSTPTLISVCFEQIVSAARVQQGFIDLLWLLQTQHSTMSQNLCIPYFNKFDPWKQRLMILLLVAQLFVIECAVVQPQVDLATLPSALGFLIPGAAADDESGFSVSAAGDINGDHIGDVLVGALAADPTPALFNAGAAYVIFGRRASGGLTGFESIRLSNFNAAATSDGFRIMGVQTGDWCGYSVKAAGDVNKDGIGDIVVGARYADTPTKADAGVTYVIFGRNVTKSGIPFANIDLASFSSPTSVGYRILGFDVSALSGWSVSGTGDINNDGYGDIIIGAPLADPLVGTFRTDAGMVYVLFGRAGNAAFDLADIGLGSPYGYRMLGATAGDNCGSVVSGAGDVNGDGIDDVIISAPYADFTLGGVSYVDAGITYVMFGRDVPGGSASPFTQTDFAGFSSVPSVGFRVFGAADNDRSGYSAGGAGDANGDGIKDIIIMKVGGSYIVFGRDVAHGATAFGDFNLAGLSTPTAAGFRIIGAAPSCVSGAGDMNGDGVDDVVVGVQDQSPVVGGTTRANAGISYVVFGRAAPFSDIDLSLFGSSAELGFRMLGVQSGDASGWSVSGAGDVNGDGFADVVVGARYADPLSVADSGASYVVFGASAMPTSQPSSSPSSQPSAQPSQQPRGRPSTQPSSQPSRQPSSQPTTMPSSQPTRQPSVQPSTRPTAQPTHHPSSQPSCQPSTQPSARPSAQPSCQPTNKPTVQPTGQPSCQPSGQPTAGPSSQPTIQPSSRPTTQPTVQPSSRPSCQPSGQPSKRPSDQPTAQPSAAPSRQPSSTPSSVPSSQPSTQPSAMPSVQPSTQPSSIPSLQPSVQPSARPSVQPTGSPSAHPTSAPSSQPTSVPSVGPTNQPSAQPSAKPSTQPTVAPSGVPTALPSSQPTGQPSTTPSTQPSSGPSTAPSSQPSAVPTTGPSAHPSSQPSSCPTSKPTAQPSSQPRASPSSQPTGAPSARPSLAPTGEWVTNVGHTAVLTRVFYDGSRVWTCGDAADKTVTCYLADVITGSLVTEYGFDWSEVTFVTSGRDIGTVNMYGQKTSSGVKSSELATCTTVQSQLHCNVVSLYDSVFLAVSYVPYAKKYVYVGLCNIYTCITIHDASTGDLQSYMYKAGNMKTLTLSQAVSPPYFVGAFVAGTTTRATAAPVSYIVVGMVRTEAGIFNAMILMPVSGDITTEVDLVCATALEPTGPDSFIAGALQVDDSGKHAYLLRANALFMTVQYCVCFRSVYEGSRRMLAEGSTVQSVVRGMVLVDQSMYMIVDHQVGNIFSLVMLQTSVSTGSIMKQVQITVSNSTSLKCTSIVATGLLFTMVCRVHSNNFLATSILLSVDRDLSFAVLPVGFVRSEQPVLHEERVPFKRTVLTITKTTTTLARSTYEFSTADQGPTRKPSVAPSPVPSSQPSSSPSSQPSSSPTAAPSVSPQPTGQPSSASPTITHKPSAEPTVLLTRAPTVQPTARSSFRPTPQVTARPNAVPTVLPTAKPTVVPTVLPTRRTSLRPTIAPSNVPSAVPSVVVTVLESGQSADSDGTERSPYVVGASVGGGLGLLLIGYVVYRYMEQNREAKARELRKAEYYRQQAILVAQSRAETAKYIQEENDRLAAIRLEKELRRADRQAVRQSQGRGAHGGGGGAYAVSPAQYICTAPQQPLSRTGSSSSVDVSALHSSEMSSVQYSDEVSSSDLDTDSHHSEYDEAVSEEGSAGDESSDEPHSSELSDFANDFMNSDVSEDNIDGWQE